MVSQIVGLYTQRNIREMNKLECTLGKEKIKLVSTTIMFCLVYIFKTRKTKWAKKKDESAFIMCFAVFKLEIPFFLAYVSIFIEQKQRKKS